MPFIHPYCRVSSDQQTLDQQTHATMHYYEAKLKARGFIWIDHYVDPETSAGIPFYQRSAGSTLNGRLQKGDAVVITKVDRAFRDTKDALITLDDWHKAGIELHIIDQGIDTSTDIGRFIFQVLAAFAEWERRMISTRMKEKYDSQRRLGNNMANHPGYGWRWVNIRGKRVTITKLKNGKPMPKEIWQKKRVPDIKERQYIVLAAELADEGYGIHSIYTMLGGADCRTDDARPFCREAGRVKRILKWVSQRKQDTGRNDLDCLWFFGENNPNTAKEPLPRLPLEELPQPYRMRKVKKPKPTRAPFFTPAAGPPQPINGDLF